MIHIYRLQTKLWEGNVFTPVCQSVHGGSAIPIPPPQEQYPLEGTWNQTGSDIIPPEPQKQAVRILLECYIVSFVS